MAIQTLLFFLCVPLLLLFPTFSSSPLSPVSLFPSPEDPWYATTIERILHTNNYVMASLYVYNLQNVIVDAFVWKLMPSVFSPKKKFGEAV
jgi:hypothetical protein